MFNDRDFSKPAIACVGALFASALMVTPASASVVYNNLVATNAMAVATRPDTGGQTEIEAGDDFLLKTSNLITGASFTGLAVPGAQGGGFTIEDVVVEIYRVFPKDSNTNRTPNVPTRNNSPSDVAFDSRDNGYGGLSFGTTELAASFTALNSVQPGGINVNTGGNGAITGQELQFDVTFSTPFSLPADHYFFVPQIRLSNGAQFYWLSASRPISGAGATPFLPDLQSWTRDEALDPDWLRVGADIVGGGASAPTFNNAFALQGTETPEPGSMLLAALGLASVGLNRLRRRK